MQPAHARRLLGVAGCVLTALGAWTAFVVWRVIDGCAGLALPDSNAASAYDGCGPGSWSALMWQDARTDWVVGALALVAVGTLAAVVMVERFRPRARG